MVSFFITTVLWQMRRILEEDDSDGPNVLMPLLLRKSQTIPIIYFGKQQKMVNGNTGWSTCPPPTLPQKGKLHDQVCWREANEIIIYGWRKFAYMMWFVKVFLPCFSPYKKHLGIDHHSLILEKRKMSLFPRKGYRFSPITRSALWTPC